VRWLDGRDAVLDAVGHHPYARLTTGGDGRVIGHVDGDVTAWVSHDHRGAMPCAFGDPLRAAEVLAALAADGHLDGARWWHLPRQPPASRPRAGRRDDWDFRWTSTPPPAVDGEPAVGVVADANLADVAALLDDGFPESTSRPGDPRARAWWGMREGGRLVACGADRGRGGVGMLAAITVVRDRRGRGLGAALTAAMTRRLLDEYDVVALGVLTDNPVADRLYRGLGFAGSIPRTSLEVA
jgi:ribosomal protein S18 acetylase RimI-like enzyme